MSLAQQFSLRGKTALVTGGEGLMGRMICETVRELGGKAISVDIRKGADIVCDITIPDTFKELFDVRRLDILVNNAVGNQKPVKEFNEGWHDDIAVGLTGAMRMCDLFLPRLQEAKGVVLNIGSDLSLIGPDHSLYREGRVKPLSYSVIKHGMVGLTRYMATTFPDIRCNCLCPGGIDQGQQVPNVPMKRLAKIEEMKGPVAFLVTAASSYMTGAILSVDGGRTAI